MVPPKHNVALTCTSAIMPTWVWHPINQESSHLQPWDEDLRLKQAPCPLSCEIFAMRNCTVLRHCAWAVLYLYHNCLGFAYIHILSPLTQPLGLCNSKSLAAILFLIQHFLPWLYDAMPCVLMLY